MLGIATVADRRATYYLDDLGDELARVAPAHVRDAIGLDVDRRMRQLRDSVAEFPRLRSGQPHPSILGGACDLAIRVARSSGCRTHNLRH